MSILDELERGNYKGCVFFVSGVCVSILLKSKAFYLFDSHSRNCFRRVSSQETSFLLNFSSIKSVVSYIFDMDREFLRTKPYEIQHVVILHLANEVKAEKKIIQNLISSYRMKVCKS